MPVSVSLPVGLAGREATVSTQAALALAVTPAESITTVMKIPAASCGVSDTQKPKQKNRPKGRGIYPQ